MSTVPAPSPRRPHIAWRGRTAAFLFALFVVAAAPWVMLPAAAADFLDPLDAFKADVRAADARTVEVSFEVAPGYYLYDEQFAFTADGATIAAPQLPEGKIKFDETFQKDVETHRGLLRIAVPVAQAPPRFTLAVNYQGCADKGLCYPPMQLRAQVSLSGFGGDGQVRILPGRDVAPSFAADSADSAGATPTVAINTASSVDGAPLDAALRSGRFWSVVGIFFAAGVLLSLTPCVLPMLPILSSIIVGHGRAVSRGRGLALAASYSLGMALVYTALGIAAGLAGEGLAAALQNAWVLGAFAAALVLLALSMFGLYELRLPQGLHNRLDAAAARLPGGRFAGVFAMGGISALIVSPCVAAPLAGALLYLSQTRDVLLGGAALFALAGGMSVPLLLLGASAGALLPKAGAWMDGVKQFFGVLLLGVALWIVQPVLPAALALALWSVLLLGCAVVLFRPRPAAGRAAALRRVLRQGAGAALGVFGVLQMIGAASGGADPLQPLAHLAGPRAQAEALPFKLVRNIAELDAAVSAAGRPVMLDFYADWCVSCKEMERFTFSDAAVRARLAGAVLLKADVTQNNADDRALLKRFSLFGPPGTIFFDPEGREIAGTRVIGYQDVRRFIETLGAAGL